MTPHGIRLTSFRKPSQRVRPEVAGPMTSSTRLSGIHNPSMQNYAQHPVVMDSGLAFRAPRNDGQGLLRRSAGIGKVSRLTAR